MRILHVTLGNPNTHQGGLSRYCKELVEIQKEMGHSVGVLYPGSFRNSDEPMIKKKNPYLYEIHDALPVAITYGIDEPSRYMVKPQNNTYKNWLNEYRPEVIHIHSFQGIHKEFFEEAFKLKIPIIFTTHDYYPICFRCVLIDSNQHLCNNNDSERCALCNAHAGMSEKKQKLLQSNIYQVSKDLKIVKKIKRTLMGNTNLGKTDLQDQMGGKSVGHKDVAKYQSLRDYYKDIMAMVSTIHCNSAMTAEQYRIQFPDVRQKIVPITHSNLKKCQHLRKNEAKLNISYMGGMSLHKGYRIVLSAMELLDKSGFLSWNLWLYGGEFLEQTDDKRYHYEGFFTQKESQHVWENTDLLIVASQCRETFGFIVLEALCQGIPVICSNLVGSKDLVSQISSELVFHHSDSSELVNAIVRFMNRDYYNNVQKSIEKVNLPYDMKAHVNKIMELYNKKEM